MSMAVPIGGLLVFRSSNQVSLFSYRKAPPMRSVSVPLPLGFHTITTRGAKFAQWPFHMAPGMRASRLKSIQAGAFGYTLLICPARNAGRLKELPRPYLSVVGKFGSQRRPAFKVKREEI